MHIQRLVQNKAGTGWECEPACKKHKDEWEECVRNKRANRERAAKKRQKEKREVERKKKKEARAKKREIRREQKRRREEEKKKTKEKEAKQATEKEGNRGAKKGVEKWAKIGEGLKKWWRKKRKGKTAKGEKWWRSREYGKGRGIIMRVARWVAKRVGWKWEIGMRMKLMRYGDEVRMLKEREGGSRMGFEYGTKWGWKMKLDEARDLVEYTERARKSGREWIGEEEEGTERQKKDRKEIRKRERQNIIPGYTEAKEDEREDLWKWDFLCKMNKEEGGVT